MVYYLYNFYFFLQIQFETGYTYEWYNSLNINRYFKIQNLHTIDLADINDFLKIRNAISLSTFSIFVVLLNARGLFWYDIWCCFDQNLFVLDFFMVMERVRNTLVSWSVFVVNWGRNLDQRPISNVQTLPRLINLFHEIEIEDKSVYFKCFNNFNSKDTWYLFILFDKIFVAERLFHNICW